MLLQAAALRRVGLAVALSLGVVVFAERGRPGGRERFAGEVLGVQSGPGYTVEGCFLSEAIARQVMKFCSLGQQCEITGITEHCRHVRGACIEMTRLLSARWGKNAQSAPLRQPKSERMNGGQLIVQSWCEGQSRRAKTPSLMVTWKLLWISRPVAAAPLCR